MRWVGTRDGLLAALVLAAQSAPFVFGQRLPDDEPWTWLSYLPAAASALPVLFRRPAPVTSLLLTAVCIWLYDFVGSGPAQPIWYGALVCMYAVGLYAKPRHRIVALVVSGAGILIGAGSFTTAVRETLTWSAAFALGATTRTRQDLAEQAAELATARERARIARDLHDVLGHSISLMVVQAEAGAAIVTRDPVRAGSALDTIADTGRAAIAQLRDTVTVLTEARRQPSPGLADIEELVGRTRHPGLKIAFEQSGPPRDLRGDVQLAAYRITQEALTNVLKHAQANRAWVHLEWTEKRMRLTITDNGRGSTDGKGHGLIGMRERAAAAGGVLRHGPRNGGQGFQVEAVFE